MMTLTKDDVTAIKAATKYSLRIDRQLVRLELSKDIRRPERKDGFTDDRGELSRTIEGPAPDFRGKVWFWAPYCRSNGNWQALRLIVRPGDSLRFYADDGYTNDYLRAAEIPAGKLTDSPYHASGYDRLYVDSLHVDVVRKGKTIIRGLTLTVSICPQNSARAVQPAQYALTNV